MREGGGLAGVTAHGFPITSGGKPETEEAYISWQKLLISDQNFSCVLKFDKRSEYKWCIKTLYGWIHKQDKA